MELLNDMALFVEVVRAMSFRGAAAVTGVPNSTLSRRISALEKAIGLRLLHRTTRKIELTEAGQIYYERCKQIVGDARVVHEQLNEMLAQPGGVLRASLPVDFASIYLAPLLVEFASRYPDIDFEFDLTPRQVDLITEPFDVAIRMGEQPSSTLIARQLVRLTVRLYASPRYLERFGVPEHPSALVDHACLVFPGAGIWTLLRADEMLRIEVGGRFVINSIGMFRRLAILDQGMILLPEAVVKEDLASGELCPVLPEWEGMPIPVYALTETRLLPAKTQRFIEFLQERLVSCV